MTIMSIVGALMYGIVLLVCLLAATSCGKFAHASARRLVCHWLGAGGVFALLIVARVALWEDRTRDYFRAAFRTAGEYDVRWEFQLALIGGVGVLTALCLGLWLREWRRAASDSIRKLVLLSRLGLLGLVPLYGLRIASHHAVDRLLYTGPLRINWVAEAGLCALVAGSAWLFSARQRGWTAFRQGSARRDRR